MQIDKVKTLEDGNKFSGIYAVSNAEIRQTKTNKDFLSCTLIDKTGKIPAKIWGFDGEAPKSGTVWSLEAQYSPFNGQSQAVIRKFSDVNPKTVDASLFIDSLSPDEFTYYQDECQKLMDSIEDDAIRDFVKFIIFSKYNEYGTAVGAKSNPHGFIGGLLMHSVNVTKMALNMAEAYRGTSVWELINRDLLISGGLLHDIGKLGEYTLESNTIEFSSEGLLTRHYDTTTAYLMEAWVDAGRPIGRDVLNFLFHIAVTHHGIALSERPPSSISAWLICAADSADAFIQAGLEAQAESGVDEKGWTNDKIWMMGNKFFDETTIGK